MFFQMEEWFFRGGLLLNLVRVMSATKGREVHLERNVCFLFSLLSSSSVFVAGGLRGAARGGLAGLTLSGLYALYSYWDHLKGSSPTRH